MAKQKNVYATGRWGNVVGSSRYGTGYFRFQPNTISRTEGMERSSNLMGQASSAAAAFRQTWKNIIPFTLTLQQQNRFTGVVKKWLQTSPFAQPLLPSSHLPYLNEFDFNDFHTFHDRFHKPLTLNYDPLQGFTLHIPSLIPTIDISAPAYTTIVKWTIAATSYNMVDKRITGCYNTTMEMAYNDKLVTALAVPLPVDAGNDNVTLVLISLQYAKGDAAHVVWNHDMRWLPCGIVAARVG